MKKRYCYTYIVEVDGKDENECWEAQMNIINTTTDGYFRLDSVEDVKD